MLSRIGFAGRALMRPQQMRAFCVGGERIKGSVKWFDERKGFGFLVPEGSTVVDGPSDSDIFVHYSEIRKDGFKSLEDGEQVEFSISDRGGRSVALDVTGPEGAEPVGKPRFGERSDFEG
eukprot:CAMPEP_0118856182 /NCGR_PEP_ID=MMETSP1163-20130328/3760_1 /TAXON_ID=124430 /ORGANISM="Phaeomonas parva, Strain CCMP2877" /LENGTH=119 /DNA_ID=CAMNT_0006789241 /DNA_START=16 /DNA_END=375 /DNA_ORIENTATION=+